MLKRFAVAVVLTTITFAAAARGGDFASLEVIGFSGDGRYLAFEEYGTQDGSGFPYSNIYFIDVDRNRFAADPVRVSIERSPADTRQARSRARAKAATQLRRLRIVPGDRGKLVVSHLLTDLSFRREMTEKQTVRFARTIGSMFQDGDFELTLDPSEVSGHDCRRYTSEKTYGLDLGVKDRKTSRSVTLQQDATLPASRGCPLGYTVESVYLFGNRIAVFVNTYRVGFEGPDMRYLVVTGKLP